MRVRRAISVVLLASFPAGCSLVTTTDPTFVEQDAGNIGDGAVPDAAPRDAQPADGEVRCAEPGFRCGAAAPAGWEGPVILVSGPGSVDAPPCPSTAPTTAFVAHRGLSAPPAECSCTCDPPPPSDMHCSAVTVRTGSSCAAATALATVGPGECRTVPAIPSGDFVFPSASSFSATSPCTPVPVVDREPVTWEESHRACSFGEPVDCGAGGACQPPLRDGDRICIYADGNATCPSEYPQPLRTAEDVDDGRGCSACECGSVVGSCAGSITVSSRCEMPAFIVAVIDLEMCVAVDSGAVMAAALTGNFSPEGSCSPTAVAPTGAATERAVRTVCCAP